MRLFIVLAFHTEAFWAWQSHRYVGSSRTELIRSLPVSCNLFQRKDSTDAVQSFSSSLLSQSSNNMETNNNNTNNNTNNKNQNKFGMAQRIDSVKSGIVGAVSASVGSALILAIHDTSLQQWEFDVDGAAISGGLFAIVYRYCIRMDDNHLPLGQGVIGAFGITRTLARFQVPTEACDALPLTCGPPLGYLNWDMIFQFIWYGIESLTIFGLAAWAMEYVMARQFISRFPG